MDSLNFNSVETLPNLSARAAFQVNSSAVFKEDVDIVPVIIDDTLSYVPWGGDNNMPCSLRIIIFLCAILQLWFKTFCKFTK